MSDATWDQHAACKPSDLDLFFPPSYGRSYRTWIEEAKAVCATCPVRAECLTDALANSPDGIRAGLTPDERRTLRRLTN